MFKSLYINNTIIKKQPRSDFHHFTNEEQKGKETCSRSYSHLVVKAGFIGNLILKPGLLATTLPSLYIRACMLSRFSRVQLFATLWTVACQAPLSMGILQTRILEWVALPSPRGSFGPRDRTHTSCGYCIAGWLFTTESPGKLSVHNAPVNSWV